MVEFRGCHLVTSLVLVFAIICKPSEQQSLDGSDVIDTYIAEHRGKKPEASPSTSAAASSSSGIPSTGYRSRRPLRNYASFSADYSVAMRRRSEYQYHPSNVSTFFNSSSVHGTLMQYPGLVTSNILTMDRLFDALNHTQAQKINHHLIAKLFEYVRDRRYFPNNTVACPQWRNETDTYTIYGQNRRKYMTDEWLRRITWLLPDDGCYYRAELVCQWASDILQVRPRTLHKIFLFGDALNISTPYDSRGYRTWVYHVAPLIRSYNKPPAEYLVIDPSLDHKKPLPVVDWIEKQTSGKKLKDADMLRGFLITNRYIYNPKVWNDCTLTSGPFDTQRAVLDPYGYTTALADINYFLEDEWQRIGNLSWNPKEILGDKPPWKV